MFSPAMRYDHDATPSPERCLARAVLCMAIADYIRPIVTEHSMDIALTMQDAVDFVMSDSLTTYSFIWLCDHIFPDGAVAATRIRRFCREYDRFMPQAERLRRPLRQTKRRSQKTPGDIYALIA